MRQSKYFLGRVIKLGLQTNEMVVNAILEPATVVRGEYEFTFTRGNKLRLENGSTAIYGRLAKYSPEGEATVVQPEEHREEKEEIPNLLVASSPFVYLPGFSGLTQAEIDVG